MNPVPAAVSSRSRAAVVLGAATKMVARLCLAALSRHSADSCTGRSGKIQPAPPASASSLLKRSAPYLSIGFQ
jgi:hypothetical protein